jgi:ureidoacrylate peracid hydrolase
VQVIVQFLKAGYRLKGAWNLSREMLSTLGDKISPKWTAVIVIDVQNDFVSPGGAFERTGEDVTMGQAILPRIVGLIQAARENKVPVIFITSIYTTDDSRYLSDVFLHQMKRKRTGRYFEVPVCSPSSWGAQLAPGLEVLAQDTVVLKHRYSAFINTDLELRLRSQGVRTLLITGVSTSVCVESTTRHAHFLDYYNVILSDCCADYKSTTHEEALRRLDLHYGQVTESKDILAMWAAAARGL